MVDKELGEEHQIRMVSQRSGRVAAGWHGEGKRV